jgi:hypothetical protein
MSFVRAANPIWYFVDLNGLQFNDTDYLFVNSNVFPYNPAPVYMDNQGLNAWTQPIQCLANGTFPNNLYFDPGQVYQLQFRAGPTQDALLIYAVNNFVPPASSVVPPVTSSEPDENQITNPQFVFINFASSTSPNTLTLTSAGTYSIAPGWNLVLAGSGTTTITQVSFSGSENLPGNPPFALEFNNNGWTSATLEQKFIDNGAIWASGGVTTTLTGISFGVNNAVQVNYVDSFNVSQEILSGTLTTASYTVLNGAVMLSPSTNTNVSPNAFVNYELVLPPSGNVAITNIQMFGQDTPLPVSFQQETVNRQIDHSFNIYANELIIKPKNSILTAWNFALNPFQYTPTALTVSGAIANYIADQTIMIQQTASALSSAKASVGNNEVLLITNASGITPNQFALIQYVDPRTIRPYWSYIVSSLVRMMQITGNTAIPIKMRLIYRTTLPPAIGNTEPIASWGAGSDPVFQTGWTSLSPLNDPAYVLPTTYSSFETAGGQAVPAVSFDQFQLPVSTADLQTLGIVLYTMKNMAVTDAVIVDRVSLVPNKFAVDSPPQTFDEVLRECQYYWEKSYGISDLPAVATNAGTLSAYQLAFINGTSNSGFFATQFAFPYKTIKRSASPLVTLYSPTGGTNSVNANAYDNGGTFVGSADFSSSNWNQYANSNTSANFVGTHSGSLVIAGVTSTNATSFILYHYTADARLGV